MKRYTRLPPQDYHETRNIVSRCSLPIRSNFSAPTFAGTANTDRGPIGADDDRPKNQSPSPFNLGGRISIRETTGPELLERDHSRICRHRFDEGSGIVPDLRAVYSSNRQNGSGTGGTAVLGLVDDLRNVTPRRTSRLGVDRRQPLDGPVIRGPSVTSSRPLTPPTAVRQATFPSAVSMASKPPRSSNSCALTAYMRPLPSATACVASDRRHASVPSSRHEARSAQWRMDSGRCWPPHSAHGTSVSRRSLRGEQPDEYCGAVPPRIAAVPRPPRSCRRWGGAADVSVTSRTRTKAFCPPHARDRSPIAGFETTLQPTFHL